MRTANLMLLCLFLAAAGCDDGDDDSGGPGGGQSKNAPAQCDALVDRLCGRLIECKDPSDTTTFAECVAAAKTGLPCAQADAVSDGYASCMTELQMSPCSVLWDAQAEEINLPATCNGSVLFRQ